MKKIINQQDMKERNAADVFSLIKEYGKITRKQIAEQLSMSWGAVSTITSLLLDEGYISELKASSDGAAGRIPSYLEVNTKNYYAIGLDINDTGFTAVAVDLRDQVICKLVSEASFKSSETLLTLVCKLIEETISTLPNMHPICIGAAMQGIVDAENGISLRIPGKQNWESLHLATIIEDCFQIPVFLRHDPDCILYAYRQRDCMNDAILIRIDHGIGMAVMLGGEIINRPGIFELGHTVAVPGGIPCGCGKCGCLDQYASIRGIKARAGKKFSELVIDARAGDSTAKALFSEAARFLAFALSNASELLNVDKILLCGRLFNFSSLFFDEFLSEVERLSPISHPQFTFTNVSDAPLGAAMIAMSETLKRIAI